MDKEEKQQLIKIVIASILVAISLFIKFDIELINNIIYIIAYLIVGFDVILEAIKNIFHGEIFDENFLMSIATIGALFIGEYTEAIAVMLFYQIGELFQDYAVSKSRASVSSLMNIRPDYANLIKDNKIIKVSPNEVKKADIILVKPGEKIPLDGIIIKGESLLNTVALTGETLPKKVSVNDEVLSGCINNDGLLHIKVTKEFGESTVSKILDLVENASSKKSKSENFISKFAKMYTPTVVVIAIILALVPPLIVKDAIFSEWLYRALAFLVVSCPCALVISIPLSFFGGIGACSKVGVLIKGSNYLEKLTNTEIVVCDKTGTLTEGVFKVQKITSLEYSKEDLLKYVTMAESFSNHPISVSLKQAYNKEINEQLVTETKEITGKGIEATVEGKKFLVGNELLMQEHNIKYKKCHDVGTILYIAINQKFAGTILIADKIKDDSKKAIKLFKKNNIKRIVMLTGDLDDISSSVAKNLGIDEYHAELLPQDKVAIVEELMKEKSYNGQLVFIGDGINDAPVLALADIGVSMGGVGSDAALEAADIVIMNDEPSKLASAIKISKHTMRIVKENIIIAISIKIGILILSAFGLTTMWVAVFADVGVSLIAILNASRILRIKSKTSL